MKLTKWLKVLIGVLTAGVTISPLLLFGLWIFTLPLMAMSDHRGGGPGPLSFMVLGVFMAVAALSAFVRWGMSVFYLTHVILNREGHDVARVLLGIGAFVLPFLALPVYFFIYIWPTVPPDWALRRVQKTATE